MCVILNRKYAPACLPARTHNRRTQTTLNKKRFSQYFLVGWKTRFSYATAPSLCITAHLHLAALGMHFTSQMLHRRALSRRLLPLGRTFSRQLVKFDATSSPRPFLDTDDALWMDAYRLNVTMSGERGIRFSTKWKWDGISRIRPSWNTCCAFVCVDCTSLDFDQRYSGAIHF